MTRRFFTDSAVAAILADCLVTRFRSGASLVVDSNADGVGFTARLVSEDHELEFARAGHTDPVQAIQIACSRANTNLENALAEDADADVTGDSD